MAGWVVFYLFLFGIMDGGAFPLRVKLVGLVCLACIMSLRNWARVLCLLCNVMIFIQFGIVCFAFATNGKPLLASVTGLMLALFLAASVFLMKKETVAFFKQQGQAEAS